MIDDMKERPILFNGPMVRALLDGSKTQTRRAMKTPNSVTAFKHFHGDRWDRMQGNARGDTVRCPHGQPGDLLWVREAWADEHPLAVQGGRYSQPGRAGIDGPPPVQYRTIYRADGEPLQIWLNADQSHPYYTRSGPARRIDENFPMVTSNYTRQGKAIHWNPSIHMPRWASRITLEVTGVRVERLQEISEADAMAEGIELGGPIGHLPAYLAGPYSYHYAQLWESINGPGSWDENPWVWVVEFKNIATNPIQPCANG